MKLSPFSYSKLRAFWGCPWAAKKRYLDREPQAPNPILEFGSYVHSLIEKTLDPKADEPKTWLEPAEVFRAWELARRVENYQIHPDTVIGVETALALDFDQNPIRELFGASIADAYGQHRDRIWFLAKVDLIQDVDGGILIRDWKSGFPSDKDRTQADIYGAVASRWWPGREITIRIEYLQAPGQSLEIQVDHAKAGGDLDVLILQAGELETLEDFPATPGDACPGCGFRATCPWKLTDLVGVATDAQAERAAQDLEWLAAQVDARKAALRAWVDMGGRPVGYGYKARKSYTWNLPALVLALGGLDAAAPLLSVNGTKIKKAMKDPNIAALATEKSSLVFGKLKGGENED